MHVGPCTTTLFTSPRTRAQMTYGLISRRANIGIIKGQTLLPTIKTGSDFFVESKHKYCMQIFKKTEQKDILFEDK
jgi:hypothetical protein